MLWQKVALAFLPWAFCHHLDCGRPLSWGRAHWRPRHTPLLGAGI